MILDSVANFAKVTVSTGYDATAITVVLNAGNGAKLPTPPFNVVWWNSTDFSDPSDDSDVEIDRVTNVVGDTLTLLDTLGNRAPQEGTSASAKNISGKIYKMVLGPTAKTINDIKSSLFVGLTATGNTDGSNTQFIFSQKPTYIVSDGAWYTENKGWTWSSGTLTATMTIPPSTDLYGIA